MPVYNKLVRDRIPEIIYKSGKKYSVRILDSGEYIKELQKKMYEELEEYINAKNDENALEELADILEIVHSLSEVHGGTIDAVEEIRKKKADERGGFKKRILLQEVYDE